MSVYILFSKFPDGNFACTTPIRTRRDLGKNNDDYGPEGSNFHIKVVQHSIMSLVSI
jgi:hypothetical protein